MKLMSNLRKSSRFKNALYIIVGLCLFSYSLSLPLFGESQSFLIYFVYFAMAALTISAFIYCFLYEDLRIRKAHLLIPLFALFAFIGTAIYSQHFRQWVTLILLAISFFSFYYAFKALKKRFVIISVIAAAFFAFSIYYIVHYGPKILDYRSYTNSDFRLGWDFDNPNGVGIYAIIGVSMPLYLCLFWKSKWRYAFLLPVLTSALVGLTTGSRTFLVVTLLMVLVFLYFKFKNHKIAYLIVVVCAITIFVILLFLPFMSTLRDRLLHALKTWFGTETKVDTSTIERTVWLDYGFYLGAKNIIFGYGVEGFSVFSGVGTYTHSNFSEVFCDFGIIGLIIFYIPLIILLSKTIRSKTIEKSFVLTFFVLYFITSFSTVFYYKKIYYLVLAFLFYLVYVDGSSSTKQQVIKNFKRVVFTCDSMGSGGAEKVISLISNEMVKQGIDVSIIGVADPHEPKSFYPLDRRILYQTCSNGCGKPLNPIKRVFKLRKMLINKNPDVVISFLPNANIYTWLSLINTEIPYVVSERNNPYIDPKGKLTRFLKKVSFYKADGVVFQTKGSMNYYSEAITKKGIIIKNPIKPNITRTATKDQRKKTVLAVGRLAEQKNYPCLLNAFKIFNQEFNGEYTLKIYGEGPLEDSLKVYCETLGIENFVNFEGSNNEWHTREANVSLYVLSSDYEGLPNALAEAMALGIPCVSTDCPSGGPAELITNGVNGYLSPVNDYVALSRNMIKAVGEPQEKYVEVSKNMINEYSPEAITIKWINYFLGLQKDVYE